MKRILLASASIVAFAGAAAAQEPVAVSFGGSAELGFNDEEENGFFYEADLDVTFAAPLDNGLTAQVTFTIPVAADSLSTDNDLEGTEDFVLSIASPDFGGLFFGDVKTAAEVHWDPGFAMASDAFSEQDNETVLRGDGVFGGFEASASALIADPQGDIPGDRDVGDDDDIDDFLDQIAVGASGSFGAFTMNLAYQEESDILIADPEVEDRFDTDNDDWSVDQVLAIAAGTTFGGADVKFAFARREFNYDNPSRQNADGTPDFVIGENGEQLDTTTSYGVLVRYPFGPVTAVASYTFEPDFEENSFLVGADYESGPIAVSTYYESEIGDEEFGVEAVYSPSETTTYAIGYIEDIDNEDREDITDQDEGFYVQARQGIGAGAYVEASYSEFTDAGPDEVREGTTVLVGFEF